MNQVTKMIKDYDEAWARYLKGEISIETMKKYQDKYLELISVMRESLKLDLRRCDLEYLRVSAQLLQETPES